MYENVRGIRINGTMFESGESFDLFSARKNIPTRMSIVYGRNGSGKSTVTKGFQKYSSQDVESIVGAELYDFDNSVIAETDEIRNNIFTFNEDFIEKNVRIKADGLDTIIMFGEKVDLEEEIESVNKGLSEKRLEYTMQENICKQFDNSNDVNSPFFHWNKIKTSLQGDGNWAGIERKIRGTRQNAQVSEILINSIIARVPSKTQKELKKEFDELYEQLNYINGAGEKINISVPTVKLSIDTKKIWDLLSKKIEKPELLERDRFILDLVLNGKQQHFVNVRHTFVQPEITNCPYCLQDIDESYKKELVTSIENVLGKDVEEHISDLQAIEIEPLQVDFSLYDKLDTNIVSECNKLQVEINDIIMQFKNIINQKINNVYTPMEIIDIEYIDIYQQLKDKMGLLEKSRIAYNKKFNEVDKMKKELIELNKEIAYYTIKPDFDTYLSQKCTFEKEQKKFDVIIEEGKILKRRLTDLTQKQKNIHIAVDIINQGLKYVFFSSDRLVIKPEDERYILYSNNRPVKPQDISCGERNILALCYFFTLLMNNLNEKDVYTQESFLVIDDPVSSFDLENKIGILSYLKSQLLKVMLGNRQSKVIIFSHDLATVYDMIKQFEEIKEAVILQYNEKKDEVTTNYSQIELRDFNIVDFPYRKRNEYTLLLKTIYDFADSSSIENDLAIGNIMRRALESFSTFEYKKGIDSISCDQEILKSMGNEKYSQYFENLMYRLILNGESHSEEHIKSLQDLNFYSTISTEEKRRTAKDVLCLINVLNPRHLSAHFSDIPNATIKINTWCDDILSGN